MSAAQSLEDHVRELEEQLLRPEIRRSPAALGALLTDEFVEFGTDGRTHTKTQVIAALQHERAISWWLTDFKLSALGEDVLLATYRAARRDEVSGEIVESLRSSLWVHRKSQWQVLFHQGTRVAP